MHSTLHSLAVIWPGLRSTASPVEPPPADSPLLSLDNVTLSPHVAGASRETARRKAETVIVDIANYYAGRPLQYCANPKSWRHDSPRALRAAHDAGRKQQATRAVVIRIQCANPPPTQPHCDTDLTSRFRGNDPPRRPPNIHAARPRRCHSRMHSAGIHRQLNRTGDADLTSCFRRICPPRRPPNTHVDRTPHCHSRMQLAESTANSTVLAMQT